MRYFLLFFMCRTIFLFLSLPRRHGALRIVQSTKIKWIQSQPFIFTKVRGYVTTNELLMIFLLNRLIMAIHLRSYNGQDFESHLKSEISIHNQTDEISQRS